MTIFNFFYQINILCYNGAFVTLCFKRRAYLRCFSFAATSIPSTAAYLSGVFLKLLNELNAQVGLSIILCIL